MYLYRETIRERGKVKIWREGMGGKRGRYKSTEDMGEDGDRLLEKVWEEKDEDRPIKNV